MTNRTIQTAYPPPPPPLPSASSGSSKKMLIVGIIVAIVVVAVVVVAFVMMSGGGAGPQTNTNVSPSPSQTVRPSGSPGQTSTSASPSPTVTSSTQGGTATPSPTSQATSTPGQATATPSSSPSGGFTKLRAGAWANYTDKTYDESGALIMETHVKETVESGPVPAGTYQGTDAWQIISENDQVADGELTTSKNIMYMSKSDPRGLRIEMYMNGELFYAYDMNETSPTEPGTTGEIDPSTIISYETITVAAGTFTNCAKATTTVTTSMGTTVSYMWAHQDVPIWGLVKMEAYTGSKLTMSMELTAYGG